MKEVPAITIAQVTDMHLFASEQEQLLGMPTTDSFHAVIDRLKKFREQLDLLLLTGDLSGDSTSQSYGNLQNLLSSLFLPSYWLPGNHDDFTIMNEVLNLGLVSRRKCFERGGWNFVLLDSSVFGEEHGYLRRETLEWLDLQLSMTGDKPTAIALHHPPFNINSCWLDNSSLQNSEELFAVLDKYPQVQLVLFGHIHQEFYTQRQGVDYLGTPSTCVQFQPKSKKFALDQKSPGFRLMKLYPNGTWESWIERVEYFHTVELAANGY
ncbi:MAG: 3',5'-cyclic-AMP phosphodiesterase [Rivularia sp. (in: cyanobacteria)]|jgi:Icc protein